MSTDDRYSSIARSKAKELFGAEDPRTEGPERFTPARRIAKNLVNTPLISRLDAIS